MGLQSWLKISAMVVGITAGLSGLIAGLTKCSTDAIARNFVTHQALGSVKLEIEKKAADREVGLSRRLEEIKVSQDTANRRIEERIDGIYNLLVGRRPR